ncbi:multicopper oxidase [Sphaerobolus stellatus SS14]|uniref:Multicopper oxidase n=1 Tax=Sphaerobolus stellatus (strain SS14) TaxID=990650 RepID=A0A0C9VFW4_SPHS4|nr:multicopper oxidase [Sphaerobolus stellatus SS14]
MPCLSRSFGLSVLLAVVANAASVVQDWTLAATPIAPDGFTRTAALINGVYPGPLLKANKGDTVTVNVDNQLNNDHMRKSTSIVRLHLIFLSSNDGPSFVTQCPIAPNNTYTYQLALGNQAGTYWYHSHLSTQYVDGIRGPLVIYDPEDPNASLYDVDDESTIITLSDWYHTPALDATKPVPDSGLIGSAGRFSGGPAVERTRVNVTQGQRYRLRLLSLSASGFFDFEIEGHSLTIIEADGVNHEPYIVDSIQILPGQRYSVVVNANQSVNNYWIRATQTVLGSTTSASNSNFNGTDVYAVLHYAGASNDEPTTPQPTALPAGGIAFQEFNLKPLENPGAPGGSGPADKVFNFTFGIGAANGDVWTINNSQYKSPSVPTLLNILANGFTQDSQFNTSENTFTLPPNSTIEVAFIGGAGHAFHLHGHVFDVIQSASGGPPNFVNPPRRDVVASGGTTANPVRIRFTTDNPGPWFVHCHIDWHLEAGLAAVFAEDPTGIESGSQSVQPNAAWEQLCNIYDQLDASDQ